LPCLIDSIMIPVRSYIKGGHRSGRAGPVALYRWQRRDVLKREFGRALRRRELGNACKCFVSGGRRSGHHTKQSGNGGGAIWARPRVKWPCSPTTSFVSMHTTHNAEIKNPPRRKKHSQKDPSLTKILHSIADAPHFQLFLGKTQNLIGSTTQDKSQLLSQTNSSFEGSYLDSCTISPHRLLIPSHQLVLVLNTRLVSQNSNIFLAIATHFLSFRRDARY
jgi:hypothetical protein